MPCPTDVCFGGADGATLFVASARDAVDRSSLEAAPLSGRLFAHRSGNVGVPMAELRAGRRAPARASATAASG